jgi:hypothetical protein
MAQSPFSNINPNLQTVWDATSLKALMHCPRYYQYNILMGYRPKGESVDLDFGWMFASSVEAYKRAILSGMSKEDAILEALTTALTVSWIKDDDDVDNLDGLPWGGTYQDLWHCTGTTKYKNAKGNAAKCPYSHKGAWFPSPAPSCCGSCNSPTEVIRQWVPTNNYKNRNSLIRLVVWYCDEQPDPQDDHHHHGLRPFAFPNGEPAVELSFKLPLELVNGYGEPYILAGHMDGIEQSYGGKELFITDDKTTRKSINQQFWTKYDPNIQVELYDLVGSLLFPTLPLKGVAIRASQILTEGAKFAWSPIYRSEVQREETLKEIEWWIKQAESMAEANYWPRAPHSCGICPFAGICNKAPDKRQMYLDADFEVRKWNPLEER